MIAVVTGFILEAKSQARKYIIYSGNWSDMGHTEDQRD